MPRQVNALSVSRDTLNPMLNTNILKNRLAAIEYYKTLNGPMHARWPHFFMRQTANKLWKYKFNLALKGFAAYIVYREVQNHRNLNEKTVMTLQQTFANLTTIAASSAAFIAVCSII